MMSKMAPDTVLSKLSKLQRLAASAKYACTLIPKKPENMRRQSKATVRNCSCYVPSVDKEYFDLLPVHNEPLLSYETGSKERSQIKIALGDILQHIESVPIVVHGKEIRDNCHLVQVLPYNRHHFIARYNHASRQLIEGAIQLSIDSQKKWNNVKLRNRMEIWDRAADLIATKYRFKIVAAIMLGQGKTLKQAEMDVAELVDFIRINPIFLRDLANFEPVNASSSYRNHMVLRGLTGFVAAITPFNYTSIAANLAYTPALMGNVVLWKPSDSAILSNWYVFQAMREAGVPDGVVNFLPAQPTTFSKAVTQSPKLAGIHFTGRANVLKVLWRMVAEQINIYENYPRLVGESGGKNFHFVHPSANPDVATACTIRAAFEYAGQKCSSCSMLYVPESLWESQIKQPLLKICRTLFVSEATYCDCFFSAVINQPAFDRIFMYLKYIHNDTNCKLLLGGTGTKTHGYYIDPTIVLVNNIDNFLCQEELLAPILCVYVYKDNELDQTMEKVANLNRGLCASIFATDYKYIRKACETFRNNVGTLNINDKCTGSKAGQQPFGGGAMSGTNEKLGSPQYLLRWTSPQIIKECFVPHVNVYYPYMEIGENILKAATLKAEHV